MTTNGFTQDFNSKDTATKGTENTYTLGNKLTYNPEDGNYYNEVGEAVINDSVYRNEVYSGKCQRCGKEFFGEKRQIYCKDCGVIISHEKTISELNEECNKLSRENADLKDILKGIYKNLGIIIKSWEEN